MPDMPKLLQARDISVVLDSITHLTGEMSGKVVVAASHCGRNTALLVLHHGVGAVILNDAGVGKAQAGIAGLGLLESAAIPGATVSHWSARIGDGEDCLARGVISHCNEAAAALGVIIGMAAGEAVRHLAGFERPPTVVPEVEPESRWTLAVPRARRNVVMADSASLIGPEDSGAVAVTGSHGGLLGGRPEAALKADAFAAVFNDAGVGIDRAGLSRLAPLERRGIAAVTVASWSARIGEGGSTLDEGVLSYANETAKTLGAKQGMSARRFVELAARA